ncbi:MULTISPECIES: hypothetical protein [Actinomycetes]
MTDSAILDAEYRAFVKSLHPATVATLIVAERFWSSTIQPFIPIEGEEPPTYEHARGIHLELVKEVEPELLTVILGHPDPDVRDAADIVARRLSAALLYLYPDHFESGGGTHATIATTQLTEGLREFRRAVYHAPFRDTRPEPRFTGDLIGPNDPLPPGRLARALRKNAT